MTDQLRDTGLRATETPSADDTPRVTPSPDTLAAERHQTPGNEWPRTWNGEPATPSPDTLDTAWAEAEAALPEGWIVSDIVLRSVPGPRAWRAIAQFVTPEGLWPEARRTVGVGSAPAAALRALAARLRETRP